MKASTIETWRAIAGYEGDYEVSDFGRVRSLDRMVDGPRVQRKSKGRVISMNFSRKYKKVGLHQKGLQKQFFVHRLVAVAFLGPCPTGKQVNHKDGCKSNNRPSNLEYVTPLENIQHACLTGLSKTQIGEENINDKLTEENVLDIRATYAAGGVTQQKLADNFGVGHVNISNIVHRRSWAHLPPA